MNESTIGRLFQINASEGGVPKTAVPEAIVTPLGLDGDRQKNTRFHGGPQRALCLYSLERIQALQGEGHPIYPGAIGENLTVSGLPWDAVVSGSRWRIGADVLLEITSYTVPCHQIQAAFLEAQVVRVSEKHHPGWSRVYARVLRGGPIRPGDPMAAEGHHEISEGGP